VSDGTDPTEPLSAGPILPGATLGVLGGGQLGRMFVQAARSMGYRTHVFSTHRDSPAGQAADHEHVGLLTDARSVASFALGVDAVTLEFENVPPESVEVAQRHAPVRPGAAVLRATQHRVREKRFLESVGVPVGPFAAVGSLESLQTALATIGLPAVLKTAQMGYDGKGQRVLHTPDEVAAVWEALGPGECILEGFVDFRREVSVLVARGVDGSMVAYGPIENTHARHILDVSVYPAPETDPGVPALARSIATRVAEGLDAVGLICVEMFETPGGELLVNEVAPRPHNSGHLTIDSCRTSQFEQQVRALCGLPLGAPDSLRPAAMANVLGDHWPNVDASGACAGTPRWEAALAAGASLHLYGKDSPRVGRKMGHLTCVADTPAAARQAALAARDALHGPAPRRH
jgi:5-(carboxyamino)imidazole ribonucleotide synthase